MRHFKKQLAIASLVAAVLAPVAGDAQAWWGGPWGGYPGYGYSPWGGYPGYGGWGPWDDYGYGRGYGRSYGRGRATFSFGGDLGGWGNGLGNGWGNPWNNWWW